ncbi:hypothetical protein FGB62_19g035 [Gracilaria domingensis]|nr:hypothetical protein FGB62_19g035 [Gracilaria domingensis]
MNRRIWSAVKYSMSDQHGNASLSETDVQNALKRARNSRRQFHYLDAYPYVDKRKRPLHVYDPLIPDYVIRIDNLDHDLANLLAAFGCDTNYVSGNVHQTSPGDQKLLEQVHVGHDATYNRLVEWARTKNEMGLLKAAVFVDTIS